MAVRKVYRMLYFYDTNPIAPGFNRGNACEVSNG